MGHTDQKNSLNKTFSNIEIDEDFKNKLRLIHIEIEKLKKKKKSLYFYTFLYTIIGSALVISQKNAFTEFTLNYSSYSTSLRSLLVIVIGFGLLWTAYNNLNLYMKKSRFAKNEKNKIDTILNNHQIKYSCSVEFGKKYHGNQDVIIELKSNSNLLKDSKITFQI